MSVQNPSLIKANATEIHDFHGGVHPEQNKTQTCDKGIKPAGIPDELHIPLQQHIGAPAKAIVELGQHVLKGQCIAQASGFVSASIHAPTSGTIQAIEKRPVQHPSELDSLCIVLKCDHQDRWCELEACENFRSLNRYTLLEKIGKAGIAGMGGAGFPSPVKLSADVKKINKLIINSVECEPYITADDVLIREHAREILDGAEILDHLFDLDEILIGIEDNKPKAIEAYEKAIEDHTLKKFNLLVVPTRYPSGGEKQLIQVLTGKEVPSGGLPSDLGMICHNTGSLYAIYEAVRFGIPLISRVTTVTGGALKAPQNYWTLIGTPFRFLLTQAQVDWQKLTQVIMGGPMMGFSVHDINVPVVKTTNCILASAPNELTDPATEQACIRCGSCAEVCPANLLPQQMYFYSKAKELEKTQQYHIADCIECGACSYVCPSNIPLVQYFRFAKGEIRKKNIEHEKAEISRERFEARKTRIEREAAEKEAQRLAKAQARKQKQQQQKEQQPGKQTDNNDALENAFQLAKTNAAKASKQFKEAEKALEHARKNNEDDIEQLEQSVEALKQKAEQSQEAFKKALGAKKSAQQNKTSDTAQTTEFEQKIENIREQSTQASAELKALKKSLLSAKAGSGDTSELESKVDQAKSKSDELKSQLRQLLQEQKSQEEAQQTDNTSESKT